MRRLPVVILVMVALLVAMVTGCGAHRYDGRLVAADSLMRNDPDSALALLEALPTASLTTEGDRAYHGLLISQARYKAYVVATSDSDINRALSYYRAHRREREKLTRAYIYKGAVMEELGHPDSAMYYYKSAEATAAPDDYFNLGYSKMRIGYLYGSVFAMDGKDIEKYEEAVEYFSHTNDTSYQIISLNNLGCVYRSTRPEDAMMAFDRALGLSHQLNDTSYLAMVYHSKAVLLYYQQKYEESSRLIQTVLGFQKVDLDNEFYYIASKVYSRLGQIDSAKILLNTTLKNQNNDDALSQMYHLSCLAEIALSKNDSINYLSYSNLSRHIADSLELNRNKVELLKIDNGYDKTSHSEKLRRYLISRNILLSIVAAVILFLLAILMMHYRKVHRYDRLIDELKQDVKESYDLQSISIKSGISDQYLRDFVTEHTVLMREVIEECYHAPNSVLSRNIQRIIKYQVKNKDAWVNLFPYIDIEYNNIMTITKRDFPQLEEKDLMIVALTAMGYSCAQIAIILGYSSAQGITTIRNRVAKKMGINCRLVEYVEKFKTTQ